MKVKFKEIIVKLTCLNLNRLQVQISENQIILDIKVLRKRLRSHYQNGLSDGFGAIGLGWKNLYLAVMDIAFGLLSNKLLWVI